MIAAFASICSGWDAAPPGPEALAEKHLAEGLVLSFASEQAAASAHALLFWFALPLAAAVVALLGMLFLGGRFWGASAALMGPCIALDKNVTGNAPGWVQVVTVSFLLLALAALQLYGQTRSEQSRNAADTEIGRIAAGVDSIAAGVGRQEERLGCVADAVGRQEEQLGCVADAVGSIADEIGNLRSASP